MCVCVWSHFSHVRFFETQWTVACQAPLSIGFSRQEYWNGLPCPPPEDLPDPGIKPSSLMSPALEVRFFTNNATWGSVVKNLPANVGDTGSIRKIPWRRKSQPTLVLLPGKSHGQSCLVGYSPWDHRVGHNWAHIHIHTIMWISHGLCNFYGHLDCSYFLLVFSCAESLLLCVGFL